MNKDIFHSLYGSGLIFEDEDYDPDAERERMNESIQNEMTFGDLVETITHNMLENDLPLGHVYDYANTIMGAVPGSTYWASLTDRQRTLLENAVDRRETELFHVLFCDVQAS